MCEATLPIYSWVVLGEVSGVRAAKRPKQIASNVTFANASHRSNSHQVGAQILEMCNLLFFSLKRK